MKQYFQFWKGRVWLNIIAGHWQTSFITGRKLINVNKNTKTDIKLFFIFNYPSKITSEISSPTNKTFLNLFWWYLKQIYLHIPINWINFQLINSNDVSSFFIFLYIILIKNIQYHKLWQIIQEIKWMNRISRIHRWIHRKNFIWSWPQPGDTETYIAAIRGSSNGYFGVWVFVERQ